MLLCFRLSQFCMTRSIFILLNGWVIYFGGLIFIVCTCQGFKIKKKWKILKFHSRSLFKRFTRVKLACFHVITFFLGWQHGERWWCEIEERCGSISKFFYFSSNKNYDIYFYFYHQYLYLVYFIFYFYSVLCMSILYY